MLIGTSRVAQPVPTAKWNPMMKTTIVANTVAVLATSMSTKDAVFQFMGPKAKEKTPATRMHALNVWFEKGNVALGSTATWK